VDRVRRCAAGEDDRPGTSIQGHDRRGKPVTHRVRCIPLRGPEGDVGGVIVMVEAGGVEAS
jgi:hypothetical protein